MGSGTTVNQERRTSKHLPKGVRDVLAAVSAAALGAFAFLVLLRRPEPLPSPTPKGAMLLDERSVQAQPDSGQILSAGDGHRSSTGAAGRSRKEFLKNTRSEWNLALDRIRHEPLSQVLDDLRSTYRRCPELQGDFESSLRAELTCLQQRIVVEANQVWGPGPRVIWSQAIYKDIATKDLNQASTLLGMEHDPDFAYHGGKPLAEAKDRLFQVVDY